MRTTPIRNEWALAAATLATVALAHPSGFHEKLTATVTRSKLTVLLVMDVDSGERCLLLREAVDADRDGQLSGDEVKTLEARLLKLATASLKVSVSGAPVTLPVLEHKISLREDRRASDGPLSIAVLLEVERKGAFREGLTLELSSIAPDASSLAVQVFQKGEAAAVQREVPSGEVVKVRLGRLED